MVFVNCLLFCFLCTLMCFSTKIYILIFFQRSSFQECPSKTIRNNTNHREAVTTEDTHPSIKLGHSDLKSSSFLIQLLIDVKIL